VDSRFEIRDIDFFYILFHTPWSMALSFQEKARKRKRIKAIKSKNRMITKEMELNAVQQTWQSFVSKKKGGINTLVSKKTSIFASSDANGAKVGVVNSGKGLTEFAQRKRHKF
jgi:survival of motor neuron-related-splicing factor 30